MLLAHLDGQVEPVVVSVVRRRSVFNELLRSVFSNTVNFSMGVILIMSGQALREKTLSVGDFALFVYYTGFVDEMTMMMGHVLSHYRQLKVSIDRMVNITPDGSAQELVRHGPVYLRGNAPAVPYVAKDPSHRFETLEVSGVSFRHPEGGHGVDDV